MRCRLLPHRADDGPVNMATDEWMLESVVADPSAAALRTYGWSVPTLSLGYFQRLAEVESDPRWRGRPLVRRATGGGAIWHDRELTIAVAVPAGHPLARRSKDLYRAVHEAILRVIAERGLVARRRGEAEARTTPDRPLLCFRDRDAEDLVVAGSKILGSAQRRRAGGLLQHASLLLAASAATPELPGLAELAPGLASDPCAWAGPIRDRIAAVLELDLAEHPLSEAEQGRIERVAVDVYRDHSWTARR